MNKDLRKGSDKIARQWMNRCFESESFRKNHPKKVTEITCGCTRYSVKHSEGKFLCRLCGAEV